MRPRPELALARLVARRASRSAAGWGTAFGVYIVVSALGYAGTYRTAAQRESLAESLGANAGSVGATRAEERLGRLDHLLVGPVRRGRWLAERVATGIALIALCSIVAVAATWSGAASQGVSVGFSGYADAAVNVAVAGLVVLALGTVTFGLRPRLTIVACYTVISWSFLVQFLGSAIGLDHWILDTSLFRHLSAAPAVPADWAALAVLSALSAAAMTSGLIAFARRDIVYD